MYLLVSFLSVCLSIDVVVVLYLFFLIAHSVSALIRAENLNQKWVLNFI